MAGSLRHIVKEDGTFYMDMIENMGDAHGALEECFAIIAYLSGGDMSKISEACEQYSFPDPFSAEFEGDTVAKPMVVGRLNDWRPRISGNLSLTLDDVAYDLGELGNGRWRVMLRKAPLYQGSFKTLELALQAARDYHKDNTKCL